MYVALLMTQGEGKGVGTSASSMLCTTTGVGPGVTGQWRQIIELEKEVLYAFIGEWRV